MRNPEGHPGTQLPFRQMVAPTHAWPQAPQFWLLSGPVQLPPQHSWLSAHAWRHAPQFWRSVLKSLQKPLQQVGLAPVQTLPHLPQEPVAEGARTLTQVPLQQVSPF